MTSEELASEVKKAVSAAVQERILGVGKEQYDLGDKQAFEEMSLDRLFEMAEEEALDLIAYSTMLIIRVRRLREAFKTLSRVTEDAAKEVCNIG